MYKRQIHGGARAEPDTGPGPRGTYSFGGNGPVEDGRLQAPKVATGVEPESVDEHGAGAAEGGQRVGPSARAVQRAGQQLPGRFAPRVPVDMGTQFGDEVGPLPGVEQDAGAQFHPLQPQFLEPGPLALRPCGVGHIGVGGSAPGREFRPEVADRGGVAAGSGEGVLEPMDVHVLARQAQRVAGALGDEDARPTAGRSLGFDSASQRGDECTQSTHGADRWIGPQVVDEAVGGDQPSLGGHQPGEHLTMAGSAQVDRAAVVTEGPHRTEHVDSHDPILRAGRRPRPTVLIGC